MDTLALLGGKKTINHAFKKYNSIGKEEVEAAKKVIESGVLSDFLGSWGDRFYGGENIQLFEKNWKEYFKVKNAITVNSNTSGLIAAVGAIGLEPGDEVILPPWTMSATATAVVIWGGIPVFADIDPRKFTISVESIRKNITKKTKAIIAVDILGQACNLEEIMKIAKENNLYVIEDAAQAPGVKYKDEFIGAVADIGVYSLNYHKHINTGEGGVCVTNNDKLAQRMRLIRNHGEVVVGQNGEQDIVNIIGYNFRMTEVEAAIGIEQLKKLESLIPPRVAVAQRLTEGLSGLKGLLVPEVEKYSEHCYYMYPLVFETKELGLSRAKILEALAAEGIQGIRGGYVNVHLQPMYQKKIAFGKGGFPWSYEHSRKDVSYAKGICPDAERLHEEDFVTVEFCNYEYSMADADLIIQAFKKVWANLDKLK